MRTPVDRVHQRRKVGLPTLQHLNLVIHPELRPTCAQQFAQLISTALGRIVAPHEILFDAPPVEREVDFNIDVLLTKAHEYRPLGEISPVVRALGLQFDDYVKRVRVFAHPRVVQDLKRLDHLAELLTTAIDRTE